MRFHFLMQISTSAPPTLTAVTPMRSVTIPWDRTHAPVKQSLRSRRSYGKIGDCIPNFFLQLTSACPSLSCVPCFTCACVRSHGLVTDRIGVTTVRVGGALVDICMRKWNCTRLKSHGDYIYLIVYTWSLFYLTKQKKAR